VKAGLAKVKEGKAAEAAQPIQIDLLELPREPPRPPESLFTSIFGDDDSSDGDQAA